METFSSTRDTFFRSLKRAHRAEVGLAAEVGRRNVPVRVAAAGQVGVLHLMDVAFADHGRVDLI